MDPAVAPALRNFPLLVVLVAGTWRFPSVDRWEITPVLELYEIGAEPEIEARALASV